MMWSTLPEKEIPVLTQPPLRLSLRVPVLKPEAPTVTPSEPVSVLQEVLTKPEAEAKPVLEEIPVAAPEQPEVVVQEIPPELLQPSEPLPVIPPASLPELETVFPARSPEPEKEALPEPQTVLSEGSSETKPSSQEPLPQTWPEPILEFSDASLSEVFPEIPPKAKAAEPLVSQAIPEVAVSEVSDTLPQDVAATAAYKKLLAAWLEKHKYYPRRARRLRIEGEGWLRIRIDRAGRAQDIRLERTTGNRLLDKAALEIARRADPFPALPEDNLRRELEFIVPVAFVLR